LLYRPPASKNDEHRVCSNLEPHLDLCVRVHGEHNRPARKIACQGRYVGSWNAPEITHRLRLLPLVDRKAELERLVPADSRLLYVRHLEADGTGLFAAVCQKDLKGIVGKWKHGPYLDGRDRNTTWCKVLNPSYSQRAGRDELFKKRSAAAGSA
jgi:hypothetical protein